MNNELEKEIYLALRKFESTSGVGSSPTANELLKVIRPHYQKANAQEKQEIITRIEKLRAEPGVPFPANIEQLLSK
ncbi:hypothetical protein KC222_14780 [Cedecea davisae]|uniref:Uncharacterized protein n=1 Tax=Cedecea davisae TaxID=158484 RepID=A0ABS6DJ85_9ENTR|nr:hypothetical protein [Cedecea davisae]MBU4683276.1 hypothetical protein [Cedecea davisae]MBU4686740.1 hypothetical protein [Cedecea davisae]